jgi:hypothetical protein
MLELTKLALAIISIALVIIFLDSIKKFLTKLAGIPIFNFFLPLIVLSSAFFYYETWAVWLVRYMQTNLMRVVITIMQWLPFAFRDSFLIAQMLVVFTIAILPVTFINFYWQNRYYEPFEHRYYTSSMFFILSAFLLADGFNSV